MLKSEREREEDGGGGGVGPGSLSDHRVLQHGPVLPYYKSGNWTV